MQNPKDQPQPSLEEALNALEYVPEGTPVGSEDWKDAVQLVVALRNDPQSQEKLAAKVAEKFGVRANRKLDHRDNLIVDHPGVGFRGSSA